MVYFEGYLQRNRMIIPLQKTIKYKKENRVSLVDKNWVVCTTGTALSTGQ